MKVIRHTVLGGVSFLLVFFGVLSVYLVSQEDTDKGQPDPGQEIYDGPPILITPDNSDNAGAQIKSYIMLRQGDKYGTIRHIPAVLYSNDGKQLIFGTSSGKVIFWDLEKNQAIRHIDLTEDGISALALSPDEKLIACLTGKGLFKIVEMQSGKLISAEETIKGESLAFFPDSKQIAISSSNKIEIRNSTDLKLVQTINANGKINTICVSSGGSYLAAGGDDRTVRVWDLKTNKLKYELNGHADVLYALAFTNDEQYLASGGRDRQLKIWKIDSGKCEIASLGNQPYFITALGFDPSGGKIAVGDESCDVWIYTWQKKKLDFHAKHHHECWLTQVAWSKDSKDFLFGCRPNSFVGGGQSLAQADPDLNAALYSEPDIKKLQDSLAKLSKEQMEIVKKKYPKFFEKPNMPSKNIQKQGKIKVLALQPVADGAWSASYQANLPDDPEIKKLSSQITELNQKLQQELEKGRKKLEQNFGVKTWTLTK